MISWASLHKNRHRLLRWGTIFGGFAAVQLVVQTLNAVAGFLLVRTLEKPDYAWFTIANGMSAALSILSDSGIGSAVISIGGGIWRDKPSMTGLVRAALSMRRKLAALSSLVVAAISMWLLMRNGAAPLPAVQLTILVLIPIWCVSTTAVLNVVNRLHSRTIQLQLGDLVPALMRLALTAGLMWAGGLTSATALLAVLVAQAGQFLIVRRQVLPLLGVETEGTGIQEYKRRIRKMVHQMMPNCVFLCIQGQLATWLISVFATSSEVADLGALNRLGIIFSVLGGPVGQFVAPAFARATDRKKLWAVALTLIAGCVLLGVVLLAFAWFKAGWFLWLLGSKYSHLREELVLVLAGMTISITSSLVWALNIARGWVRLSWLNIPLTLAAQAAAACACQLNSVKGLAWFVIASAAVQCIHSLATCFVGLSGRRRVGVLA